jgi:signal transduction histidine kinase
MRIEVILGRAVPAAIGAGVLYGLYVIAQYNFLLFHSLVEVFSIVVAGAIFMLAWNARQFMRNDYLLFLGIAYLFIAGIDFVHTLAYKGVGVLNTEGANLSTQLWIVGRGIEALSLLMAPLFLTRRLKPWLALVVYAAISAALFWSVFGAHGALAFPICYRDGMGLTTFKKVGEYTICGILAASLVFLLAKRRAMAPGMLGFIAASIITTISAELSFTFYVSVYGFGNLAGHLLKVVSFYLIYKAIIQSGLARPYRTLFGDLTASEHALRQAGEELEQRVRERTAQVRELALELTHIEHQERRRLTRLLHDGVQPLLVAAKMHVGMLRKRLEAPADREPLDQTYDLLTQSLEASRLVAMELAPPVLHDGGLVPALDWLADHKQTQHGLAVTVDADAAAEPSRENVRVLLFEATRELLLNVVKHAQTDAATVQLRRVNGAIEITVTDAGVGFGPITEDQESSAPAGSGLIGIRHRLELVGGRMHINSAPGEGTRIRLEAPGGSELPRQ